MNKLNISEVKTLSRSSLKGLAVQSFQAGIDGGLISLQFMAQPNCIISYDSPGFSASRKSKQDSEAEADILNHTFRLCLNPMGGDVLTAAFENLTQPGYYLSAPSGEPACISNNINDLCVFEVLDSGLKPVSDFNKTVRFKNMQTNQFLYLDGSSNILVSSPTASPLADCIIMPSAYLSSPIDWGILYQAQVAYSNLIKKDPKDLHNILLDPQGMFKNLLPPLGPDLFYAMDEDKWAILWALLNAESPTLNTSSGQTTASCWGCRTAIGLTFAVWGGSLIVALGGFSAIASTGGFATALATALGVDASVVITAVGLAQGAKSFVDFVDQICRYINACE
ncbi:MAG: hypothetical protein WAN16_11125 [Chthoniobacterales bacterium]